jgi:PAS domain S-box-containing protein
MQSEPAIRSFSREVELRSVLQGEPFSNILETFTEAVVVVDAAGAVLFMNPAALRLFEFEDADEVPRGMAGIQNLYDMETPEGRILEGHEQPLARVLRGETLCSEHFWANRKDRPSRWLGSFSAKPLRDARGTIVGGIFVASDITGERLTREAVQQAHRSLRQLTGMLLRVQDEERKRIARELHDHTVQMLAMAEMNLHRLSDSAALAGKIPELRLIGDAIHWLDVCSGELRVLSHLLHPPALDVFGLVPALRSWADGVASRTGIKIDVDLRDPGRLAPETESALFRIAQEALANVHRHSGSPTAALRLDFDEANVVLEIQDAGAGLPARILAEGSASKGMGVGIIGMRERARALGGTLEISCTSAGTTVRATLPRTERA